MSRPFDFSIIHRANYFRNRLRYRSTNEKRSDCTEIQNVCSSNKEEKSPDTIKVPFQVIFHTLLYEKYGRKMIAMLIIM